MSLKQYKSEIYQALESSIKGCLDETKRHLRESESNFWHHKSVLQFIYVYVCEFQCDCLGNKLDCLQL